jgi:hypothetical protein
MHEVDRSIRIDRRALIDVRLEHFHGNGLRPQGGKNAGHILQP